MASLVVLLVLELFDSVPILVSIRTNSRNYLIVLF